MIIHGDSIEKLRELEPNSIEALVTDPPYGLGDTSPKAVAECLNAWLSGSTHNAKGSGFMGKAWDKWVPDPALWREVYRVLRPGAHGLVFSGSRTEDLMSISLRLSGFEVRDRLVWLYSPRFPKSLEIGKAIDDSLGVERQIIGKQKLGGSARKRADGKSHGCAQAGQNVERSQTIINITAATSDRAILFDDWHTNLKPSYEPIILIRKPLIGTVADNVIKHSTGALNVGSCRIGSDYKYNHRIGRHPSNVMIDHSVRKLLKNKSRFYYCDKASTAEREAGLESNEQRKNIHPTVKPIDLMRYLCRLITPPAGTVLDPFAGSGTTLCAAALEGFNVLGVERELEYVRIAEARLAHWSGGAYEPSTPTDTKPTIKAGDQLSLF